METGTDHSDEHWWLPRQTGAGTRYPTNPTVHSIIAAQSARTPDAPACVSVGRSGERVMTYQELLSAASALAARIKEAM